MTDTATDATSGEQAARTGGRASRVTRRGLVGAATFGFGFSALVDVLVLHHVLQLHHLVSGIYPMDTLAGLRTNLRADGLFSLAMLGVLCVGAGLLWRAERRTAEPLAVRPLLGAALLGLGGFDLFDVVVDHVLLGLHQPLSQGGAYNPHWAAVSLLILGAGWYVYRTGIRAEAERTRTDGGR